MLLRIPVYIFLPKSSPMLLLYRPYKAEFVKNISNVSREAGVLDEEECYLLGNLNINLLLLQATILGQ